MDHAIYPFDGTNAAIYAVNKAAPIKLTSENAPQYAKFFFTFVSGRHGHFYIVEEPDHIRWLPNASATHKKNLRAALQPLLVRNTDENSFLLHGTVLLQDGLFETDIHIDHDGTIELQNENLLLSDLPVYKDPSAA
jgi:hypothetical protein